MSEQPQVTHMSALDIQVCVPEDWTDQQVTDFAERSYPCGTDLGWQIRRQGRTEGYQERVSCEGRAGFVHVMLDA